VATVLVDPRVLADVELASMALDLRVWPVRTAPTCADGARAAFQLRRALLMRHRGAWDLARRISMRLGYLPSSVLEESA